jgi:hypothetical protein
MAMHELFDIQSMNTEMWNCPIDGESMGSTQTADNSGADANPAIWETTPTGELESSQSNNWVLEWILLEEGREAMRQILLQQQEKRDQELLDNWNDVRF